LAEGTSTDLASLLDLAVDVAVEAGRVLLDHRGRTLHTQTKTSATDPVTAADHASERLITSRLLAARPDDGMLGEEAADDRRGTTGVRWVVDPLDATVNFTYGLPHWCVSIAAEDELTVPWWASCMTRSGGRPSAPPVVAVPGSTGTRLP
jgi:myo-inositol-1(or 4)-monophosphatase